MTSIIGFVALKYFLRNATEKNMQNQEIENDNLKKYEMIKNIIFATFDNLKDFENQQINSVDLEIEKIKKTDPKNTDEIQKAENFKNEFLKQCSILDKIIKGDIESINKLDKVDLEKDLIIGSRKIEKSDENVKKFFDLEEWSLQADMFSWAIFYAITNKTEEEKKKTINILKAMINKNILPKLKSSIGVLVRKSDKSLDNGVAEILLPELLLICKNQEITNIIKENLNKWFEAWMEIEQGKTVKVRRIK